MTQTEDLEKQMTMDHKTAAAIITLNSVLFELNKEGPSDKAKLIKRITSVRNTLLCKEQNAQPL